MSYITRVICLLFLLSGTSMCLAQSDNFYRIGLDSKRVKKHIEAEIVNSFHSSFFNPYASEKTAGIGNYDSINSLNLEAQAKWLLSLPLRIKKLKVIKDSKSIIEGYEFYYVSIKSQRTGYSAIFAVDIFLNVYKLHIQGYGPSQGYIGFIYSVINHAKSKENLNIKVKNLYKYIEIESKHDLKCVCLWLGQRKIRKKYEDIFSFFHTSKYDCGTTRTHAHR